MNVECLQFLTGEYPDSSQLCSVWFKMYFTYHEILSTSRQCYYWWIQTGVTVRKYSIWIKLYDFFSRVTSQFDGWPWKYNRAYILCYLSFVHHFVANGEFKLELQSGNAQFGSKSTVSVAVWPSSLRGGFAKTMGKLFYATSSFVDDFAAIGEFKLG